MGFDYDLFVIGAGSGGVRAARVAAQLGARVVVAEDRYMGGTCVNVGCVPKKLFVYSSQFSESFAAAEGFGWDRAQPEFHWPQLRANKDREINRLNAIYQGLLDGAGARVIKARATIVDAHTLRVNGEHITAERILIATGGWPNRPSFEGAEYVIDSNEFFHMETLPRSAIVQGGGYIAVEFAGILNGWGVDTQLVYRQDLFLRSFDQGIREFIAEQMRAKGIRLVFNTDITKVEKSQDGSFNIRLSNKETVTADLVMSAIGRHPNTLGLGLEHTLVETNEQGFIKVNDHFQTAEPSIYALGDVIGGMALTPVALAEGMALAKHLYGGEEINMDYKNIATAIFCQPNIGTVGLSEEQAQSEYPYIDVYQSVFTPMKNTLGALPEKTMMKLIVNRDDDRILGAHMVGPEAGEIIQGLAIAIKAGATKTHFDRTIGIHPTAAEEFVTMREPRA